MYLSCSAILVVPFLPASLSSGSPFQAHVEIFTNTHVQTSKVHISPREPTHNTQFLPNEKQTDRQTEKPRE